ncbi:glycosyltransferase family 9 protein, partial [Petrachloros mirabilis]
MNVLLVRPDGIGDVVLSLPVASQLRRLVPGVKIGFLTSPVVAPILNHHPDVDYVRTVRWEDPLAKVRRAFSDGVDVAIFLKPFRRLMWAAFLARVPVRVATGYRWYSLLANRRVYEHRSDVSKHESEYNVGLLAGLGLRPGELVRPTLSVTGPERDKAEKRWGKVPLPRVVVHPGGVQARRWRPEHYRDLAFTLARQGCGVALTGNETEGIQFAQQTLGIAPLPSGLINVMGQLSV